MNRIHALAVLACAAVLSGSAALAADPSVIKF